MERLFREVFDLVDESVDRITEQEIDERLRRLLADAGYDAGRHLAPHVCVCGEERREEMIQPPYGVEIEPTPAEREIAGVAKIVGLVALLVGIAILTIWPLL